MMIEPPIDKLMEKVGNKYALTCLLTRRAKFLVTKKPDLVDQSNYSPITLAAKELYEDKIKMGYEG